MEQQPLMSESIDVDDTRSIGHRLQSAREKKGLSEQEVASHLHLRVSVIKSLEADQYDIGVPMTFVLGYIKNYAKFIGLPIEDIRETLSHLKPKEELPDPPMAPRTEVVEARLPMRVVTFSVAIILGIMIVSWWNSSDDPRLPDSELVGALEDPDATQEASSPASPVVADEGSPTATQEEAPHVADAELGVAADPTAEDSVVVTDPDLAEISHLDTSFSQEAADESATPEGFTELKIIFTKASWVKVEDSRGKRLIYGTKQAGKEVRVQGVLPFEVILGNAHGVSLVLAGKAIDFQPHIRRNVAKFQLDEHDLDDVQG